MATAFTVRVIFNIAISLAFLTGPVQLDEITTPSAYVLDFLTRFLYYYFPEDLFNPDPRIEEGFRLLFQFIRGYLSQNNVLSVRYLLCTPQNSDKQHILQPTRDSLGESGFDSKLDSIVIIHGYDVKLPNTSVYFDIKDQLLLESNYNVILVDWTDYNNPPYLYALAYSYLVGLDIANLIDFLVSNANAKVQSFHLVGHSLGAQIAGITGKSTRDLRRITGLDAAGPVFQLLPTYLKLTYSDAKFVDSVHTNGQLSVLKGFGTLDPYADMDFFPNGGSTQTNCDVGDVFLDTNKTKRTVDGIQNTVSCSHDRAAFLFLSSINNTRCRFLSVLCHSYEDFTNGNCQSPNIVAEMGFHAKPIPSSLRKSSFFLNTSDHYPYCIPNNH